MICFDDIFPPQTLPDSHYSTKFILPPPEQNQNENKTKNFSLRPKRATQNKSHKKATIQ